jgi:hypothetical protein
MFMPDPATRKATAIMAKRKTRPGNIEGTPFSYRETADGKVFIAWQGRQVTVLTDKKAAAFLGRIAGLPEAKQQLLMARVTGNFKRGNERS